jgi:hypothetical protein
MPVFSPRRSRPAASRNGRGRARTAAELAELEPWNNPSARDGGAKTEAELAEKAPWTDVFAAPRDRRARRRRVKPRYEIPPPEETPEREKTTSRGAVARLKELERPTPAPKPPPPTADPAPDAATIRMRTADTARRAREYAATSLRQRRPWLIVGGLVIAGLVARLLAMRGIWVDEAISVHQAHMSLPDMLDDLRETDRHPPLHNLILWLQVRLFGDGELAVRMPSILASTALIPALFITGRTLFDRRTGLVAAALAAFAPLVIWYGQEARMYALFMLLAALALWAQVLVLREGRPRHWVAYGALTVALLYTHYFAIIPIAIQQIVFAVAAWKRARAGHSVRSLMTGLWLTWLALLIAAAPLAPFAHEQLQHDQAAGTGFGGAPSAGAPSVPDGSSLSAYAVLSNFVWAIWGYHADSTMLLIAALWPLLMLLSLGLLGQRRTASTRVLLALAIGPVLLLLLVGLAKRDLFEVRYFVGAVPMMLLLLARAVAGGARRRTPALVATGVLCATLLVGLADQQLNPNNPRKYDFRGALEEVRDEAGPGDTLVYAPAYLRDVVAYYAPEVHAEPLRGASPPATGEGRVFVIASFLEDSELAGEVDQATSALVAKRTLVEAESREKIRVWEFE